MTPEIVDSAGRAPLTTSALRPNRRDGFFVVFVWLALGCADDPRVRLDVLLQTDHRPGIDFVEVRTRLLERDVEERSETTDVRTESPFLAPRDATRFDDLAPAVAREVVVELLRSDGSVLQAKRTTTRSQRTAQVLVTMCLQCQCPEDDPSCEACPPGQRCDCGRDRCVPDTCAEREEACAPGCQSDAECQATELSCVDAVCRNGACLRAPDDARCAADQVCEPTEGCRLRSAYARAVLEDGPVAYWRLGEPAGSTTARDATGNGWDLSVEGVVVFEWSGALAGDPDTAMFVDVDGAGTPASRLTDSSGAFPDVTVGDSPYTFEAWVRRNVRRGEDYRFIAGRERVDGDGQLTQGAQLAFQFDRLRLRRFVPPDSNFTVNARTDTSWPDRFVHVVGTFDGRDQRIFLDGVEAPLVDVVREDLLVPATVAPFVVGRGLDGWLDEVAVYDYALSAARIAHHHAIGMGGEEL